MAMLQVEDDENDIFFLENAFRKAQQDLVLRSVRSAEEAIGYLEGSGPFADRAAHPLPWLILLDLKLPGQSGFDLLKWIRAQPGLQTAVVILLTASACPEDMERAAQLGANSYVEKPGNSEELVDFLKALRAFWFRFHAFPQKFNSSIFAGVQTARPSL